MKEPQRQDLRFPIRAITRRRFVRFACAVGASALPTGAGLVGCAAGCDADSPASDGDGFADGSSSHEQSTSPSGQPTGAFSSSPREVEGFTFTEGVRRDRGFVVDDALEAQGHVLHFSLHVPDSYNGNAPFALYVACPGWEGLYFQGIGAHLQEDFPFVANSYIPDMIVATPQLDDWGETSAQETILLTEWLLAAFNIDSDRVYLSGCSGGGETLSLVLGKRPDLYRRALHAISRWDGDVDVLADSETPVYITIGKSDDYYGCDSARDAYDRIRAAYLERKVDEARIDELIVLDIKPASYFDDRGWEAGTSQHAGGGALFPHDERIMGWLFR